uniref:IS200/IS605 family transposase n=1 Tax=Pyrococcus abyssi TaxID=29292 RepID=A0A5J6XUP9_PYRAY|nr:IS200/IS605 family accessory protein TnpB-related protein [Pyrococcus abyssi]QFN51290.1 IS200/IS605 family transposase [Pyrococcus abyssi]
MRVTRTVVLKSERLPKKIFKVFIELEGMYREMLLQILPFAVQNGITSPVKLKAEKYKFLRELYPQLPSHYAYTVCQDAVTRAKSFLKRKRRGLAKKECPEVRSVSIWLDDHLWRAGLTFIRIATHKGWIEVGLEGHKYYWKTVNSDWKLASQSRVKLDKRERRLIVFLVFYKDVREYKAKSWIPIDVNEDNVTALIDFKPVIFETNQKKITLGYYYRRKKVQEKWDKKLGSRNGKKRRILGKLREKDKKRDIRNKLAKIIVEEARKRNAGIVLERLPKNVPRRMLEKVSNKQLRHRIYQSAFLGIQKAIERKAKEYGVPVIKVNPKNSSRLCPIHNAVVKYESGRFGVCSVGGEVWHRDILAVWNLYLRALQSDGSNAPSSGGLFADGSPVPLGSTATNEAIWIEKSRWLRWNSLPPTQTNTHLYKKKR